MDAETISTGSAWGAATRRAVDRIASLRPAALLAPLAAAHIAVVAWVASQARHQGWVYGAADEDGWWSTASAVARLTAPESGGSYGLPAFLWPLALAAGGDLAAALPALVVAQVTLGGAAVLVAVYAIAARIGGRPFGYAAAAAWVVAPLTALGFFYAGERVFQGVAYSDFRGVVLDVVVPHAVGLAVGPAFASLVTLAVAAWLLVRFLDGGDHRDLLLAGLLTGLALGVDPANALFLPAPAAGLAVARRSRALPAFAAALAPGLVALALWRGSAAVDVPTFSLEALRVNFVHLRGGGWSLLLVVWIVVAGAFAIVRKAPAAGALVAAWFGGFALATASYAFGSMLDGTLLRTLVPAFPAFVLLAAGVLLLAPTWGRPRDARAAAVHAVGPARLLPAAALLLAAYPVVLAAIVFVAR